MGLYRGKILNRPAFFWWSFLFIVYLSSGMNPSTLYSQEGSTSSPPTLDIILVLDNSGSMQKNDPDFLTKKVVANFLEGLSTDSRVGVVIFGESAELAMPLTSSAESDIAEKVERTLGKITYREKYTNIPAAIERAIYELKQNGRDKAEKLIIFMTDGILDTGDQARDLEKLKWLKEDLSEESRKAGIRIFGVAFTEQADFELIQTLGQKTNGGYYRALKTEDIQGVFSSIQKQILTPSSPPELQPQVPAPTPGGVPVVAPEERGIPTELLIVAIVGVVALGMIAFFFLSRSKKEERSAASSAAHIVDVAIPAAKLMDLKNITGRASIQIKKRITTIGRLDKDDPKTSPDVAIPAETVSAQHANLEYRDNSFYIVDLRSSNGTFVNKEKVSSETRLKGGDILAFDRFEFRFELPGVGRGKTVLSSGPARGGTTLRQPEPKPSTPAPEPVQQPPVEVKAPAKPVEAQIPETPEPEEKETKLKQAMCPNHKSFKATELCPECKNAFCKRCMIEKDGKTVCIMCAA